MSEQMSEASHGHYALIEEGTNEPLTRGKIDLNVRSVHGQVSRERLREEHPGGFRMVISAKSFIKNPVKLCAERTPKASLNSDLS
jgi:hypothetical protein